MVRFTFMIVTGKHFPFCVRFYEYVTGEAGIGRRAGSSAPGRHSDRLDIIATLNSLRSSSSRA